MTHRDKLTETLSAIGCGIIVITFTLVVLGAI